MPPTSDGLRDKALSQSAAPRHNQKSKTIRAQSCCLIDFRFLNTTTIFEQYEPSPQSDIGLRQISGVRVKGPLALRATQLGNSRSSRQVFSVLTSLRCKIRQPYRRCARWRQTRGNFQQDWVTSFFARVTDSFTRTRVSCSGVPRPIDEAKSPYGTLSGKGVLR